MISFWQKLKKPIYVLAPMAGITDSPFRQICKEYGADVVYSEMASTAALFFNPQKTLEMLEATKKEEPYVIQLFGSRPEHFVRAVKLLSDKKTSSKFQVPSYMVPSGFDINFGCPVKKVQKQGAGAILMNNFKLAREIIKATIDNTDLPISIKCRSKVGDVDVLQFLDFINDLDIKTIMIHGRALSQGHVGPVDFNMIKKAKNHFGGLILANGGVDSFESAQEIIIKTKVDGLGIGKGALGRPWIFKEVKSQKLNVKSKKDIYKIILKHAKLVKKLKGESGIVEFRKHLCWYVSGWEGAKELRQKFIKVDSYNAIKEILD